MAAPPTPPDQAPPPPGSARRGGRNLVFAFVLALLLILAALTTFWWATGSGPFASIGTSTWAWDMTQITDLAARGLDGTGVTVCIVDTGIDLTHPDLQGVSLVAWHDYVRGRPEPYDDEGHGTAMAGIIFARGRIHGVAPAADLIAVKAISSSGSGTDSQVANAITFCIDPNRDGDASDGAEVISLSLGGGPHPILGDNSLTKVAVDSAMDRGVIVVAAAGNDGQNDDGDVESPASVERVIAVGAVDRAGAIAPFSSMGSPTSGFPPVARQDPNKKPEVVAPGVEIATLLSEGRYAYVSGTSPAAALVSGLVALLLQDHALYRHQPTLLLTFKAAVMYGACACSGSPVPHEDHLGYGIALALGTDARL